MLLHEFMEKLRQYDQMATIYLADWNEDYLAPEDWPAEHIRSGMFPNGTQWVVIGGHSSTSLKDPK